MFISKVSYGYGESKNVFLSSVQKTSLTFAGLQTTPSHVSQFRAENRNLLKSGFTLCHGTVFAPKQCLYQKEATGMESPKMYWSHRCKNLTYLYGLQTTLSHTSQYRAEHGNFWKTGSTFCHGTMFAPKELYNIKNVRVWRVKKCIPVVGAKTSLTCVGLQMTPSHVSQYKVENRNLKKSGCTFCHGTGFAPKQCLYEKEATGMESLKMYSSLRCKKPHLPVGDCKRPYLM